ncbi:MAG: PIG-L deacetylase family protein [Ardenticatenaceae bacterium]
MKVLVVSVHPDDETLGCGGTLLGHQAQGDAVHWLIVTQTYTPQWTEKSIERKAAEVDRVAKAYEMRSVHKLQLPTVRLDTLPQAKLIDGIRQVIDQVRPEVVYLVHDGDVHTDHHAVFTATMSVLKAFYMGKWGVRRILCYETLSSTEAAPPQFHRLFVPTIYHDITPYIEQKIEIMGLYESEVQPDPLPRGPSAIRALARYRGATIGVEYAEAFMLIREVS